MGGLQVDHHRALFLEMIGDLTGGLEALGLYQDHFQLGGGVDVDDLPAPAVYGAAAVNAPGALVDKGRVAVIKNLLVIVILVAERTNHPFDVVEKAHGGNLP